MILPSEFGLFLRKKREEANLTQNELASSINKTGQYISNIEKGKNCAPPNDSDIELLITVLKLNHFDSQQFREKAAADHKRLPTEQMNYLFSHRNLLDLIYFAQTNDIDDLQWAQILKTISGGK